MMDFRMEPSASVWERMLKAIFVLSVFVYIVVIPPFEVHDEAAHFAKAVQLSSWSFPTILQADQPGAKLSVDAAMLLRLHPSDAPNSAPTSRSFLRLLQEIKGSAYQSNQTEFVDFAYIGSYLPAFYLPQSVGLVLGQAVGLSPLGVFYAGRISAGLVAICLVLIAVNLMPYGRCTLLTIAVLPGTAAQFGSYSADSLLFGLSFLLIAALIRAALQPSWLRGALVTVLVTSIVLFKGVYFPIAATALGRVGRWRPRVLAPTLIGLIIGFVLFGWWISIAGGQINPQHYQSRRTLLPMTTSPPGEQIRFILAHPVAAATAILSSIVERMPVFTLDWIGRFGAFNVFLSWPAYALGLLLLVVAPARIDTHPLPTWLERALWLAIVATVFVLVHIALYVTATALGADYVEGVQGRYFVPVLPLVALALRFSPPRIIRHIILPGLPLAAAVLAICAVSRLQSVYWVW